MGGSRNCAADKSAEVEHQALQSDKEVHGLKATVAISLWPGAGLRSVCRLPES